ncbi:secretin receptor isoform X2 [Nelusetta ayraudi]|uniref:secretin receptor isoform X2 n=1 Tax=Nelusetta ayraudi TaxID=303726 RepID=UPI003F712367
MEKVALVGALFLQQVNWSSGCRSHANLMKEEEKCIEELLRLNSHQATVNKSIHCKGMWDKLNCWPPAALGEIVSQPCPDHEFFNSEGMVHRNCTADGWTHPLVPHEDACYTFNDTLLFIGEPSGSHMYFSYVKTMYTVGYALSLIALTIAIAIFCLFRKLHCTRNYIHIQMFISFILRAIFIFVRDSLLFNEERYHCDYYPAACKVVLMLSNYSILANYTWLLVEGHFLFTLVSRSFFSLKKHLAWYIALSWGVPLVVIAFWGCAKYFFEDEGCWETRRHLWIWWILRVPVLLTICMNLVFFLGILRVLVGKLRMSDAQRNEFCQYKRLIKSTFFLVALFGLHCILFVFLPVEVNSSVFKIWTFAELALSSTQGFVVAVLYCFLNGEVQHELQRRWRRWRLTQHLPSQRRRRQQHGSLSHSSSPQTQVLLLPCTPPAGQATSHTTLPLDTVET